MKGNYSMTHFLRVTHRWCSRCREKKNADKGVFEKLDGGLRQRWVCDDCKEAESVRSQGNGA